MPLKNDGSYPYGSRVLTITLLAQPPTFPADVNADYIADNIQLNRPSFFLENRDELNKPKGGVQDDDFVTGSATLQLATAASRIPTNGCTFSVNFGPGAEDFYISDVGQPEERGGLKKVNIQFRKKYN